MCGILGIVFRDPRQQADPARIAAARDTLTHRGPDEAGLWSVPGIALAHRRLKVQDLTHGQQPMVGTHGSIFPPSNSSAPATHALVFNGEIYNHAELRKTLVTHGRTSGGGSFRGSFRGGFRGSGDTETLFHLLNHHGPAALTRLQGMFALGHWDHTQRHLLLARDRLGQKPLYWHHDGDQLVFASELKAILHYLDRTFDLDAAALDEFFTRGYICSPRTIFQGIQKLPAASRLRLSATDWQLTVEPWWDVETVDVPTDEREVVDELDRLLNLAVRKRLVSDVPLGCLLSGGIDSSLITAMAAKARREQGETLVALSIGFDESDAHNELPFAEIVAQAHGCDWRPRNVRGGDFLADLDDALRYFDEPYGNFTVIAQRKLAQLCREELTVVLSGQGGDELAAGYPGRYNWAAPGTGTEASHVNAGLPRHRHLPPVDGLHQYLAKTSFVGWPGQRSAMFNTTMRDAITEAHAPCDMVLRFWKGSPSRGGDTLGNVLYADVKTNLPDYLVCIEERMTMSASVEARNPMLDHDVVNYLMSLPGSMKIRHGQNKWPLWKLCERYLPREAYDRPKRGFTPPLHLWLTRHADAIARKFADQREPLSNVFSLAWQGFLERGDYRGPALMPTYYSLVLSIWLEHYGKYIKAWHGTSGARTSGGGTWWHRTFRDGDAASLAESRWFAQALGNFPEGCTLRIVNDPDGFFAWIAVQLGHTVTDDETCERTVVVGELGVSPTRHVTQGDVVCILPFALDEQALVQKTLQSLGDSATVQGSQAVQIDADRGVLIARLRIHDTADAGLVA